MGGKPLGDPRGLMVPEEGIEPSRCRQRGILSPVRLPIPPLRLREKQGR